MHVPVHVALDRNFVKEIIVVNAICSLHDANLYGKKGAGRSVMRIHPC